MLTSGDSSRHLVALCLEWPSPSRHVGGVGRYAYRLTRWLSAHARVSVVTGPDPEPLAGVDLYPVGASHFDGQLKRYYVAPIAAAKIAWSLEPTVVHSHGDDLALACRSGGAPIIRTFYGCAAAEARSGRWLRRANHVVLSGMEHASRRRAARTVAIGPDSARLYRADALVPPVLPGDLPAAVGDRAEEPTVVFIGGFKGRKRGYLAAEIIDQLRRRCRRLRLVVFGPEVERYLYPSWVDFRARATDAEIRSTLADAWVLLAPSTYEGFGIPAWEAMGSGAVVVGSPNPGLTFLAGGDHTLIVEDAMLSPTLHKILTDGDARGRAQQRGRDRAEEIAEMGDPRRYLQLMDEIT